MCHMVLAIALIISLPSELRSCCAYGPEVGHAGRQPASANCVQTMWLAEHGLHSDSGYIPKELMGQRDRLSDKDFNDTIASKIQLPM